MKKSKNYLSFIEFVFNRSVYSTTDYLSFKIVYGFNLLYHLDLIHLPVDERLSFDGNKKALHDNIWQYI